MGAVFLGVKGGIFLINDFFYIFIFWVGYSSGIFFLHWSTKTAISKMAAQKATGHNNF